jgi:hypothetical protein
MTTRCPECGAEYSADGDSCEVRFERLLALGGGRQLLPQRELTP